MIKGIILGLLLGVFIFLIMIIGQTLYHKFKNSISWKEAFDKAVNNLTYHNYDIK